MTKDEIQCKSCGAKFAAEEFHAGFSDEGFLYCDRCSTILTWFAYDPDFDRAVGAKKMPWTLTEDERRKVEDHLVKCPCGGRFLFANPLLCPACGKVLSQPMAETIYAVVLGQRVDGEKRKVWKE